MTAHADTLRLLLSRGPAGARQLLEKTGLSQPTLSRSLSAMGAEIVRIGAARSIQYALRDRGRGVEEFPVYRVGPDGKLTELGLLTPVRPDGFVVREADGMTRHSDSLPWWLLDMRPQGFLGRAYAARHAQDLGLPPSLSAWNDTHMLRALLAHGADAVGNLLLGEGARERFLHLPLPTPVARSARGAKYVRLAREASNGELPGSSAGGEQPKFSAFVARRGGPAHVLVKFSLPDANSVTQRWRDLLLAEHHALETLRSAGVAAGHTEVIDHGGQRFLEVDRFDRVGALGRRGVVSLAAMEAEFIGDATAAWPGIVKRLAALGLVTQDAVDNAALLHAFGTLIGNTDMHHGNLSLVSERGQPFALAPAYDMLPMGFAPKAGGALPDALTPARLHPGVPNAVWASALVLARDFLQRVESDPLFSSAFEPCAANLGKHIENAQVLVARLG